MVTLDTGSNKLKTAEAKESERALHGSRAVVETPHAMRFSWQEMVEHGKW